MELEKEEKKQLLEEKNIHLWFVGSPVSLQSMKLELDMNVGAIFAYGKFMNVQPESIRSMVCDVICYDSQRHQIDVLRDCLYDGFEIKRNEEFGTKVPFKVTNQATRNLEFVLKSVTTMSGQTWNNRDAKRFNISLVQDSIFNVQADLHRQFIANCAQMDIDQTKLILQPKFEKAYWLCACGSLNWSDETTCCCCGVTKKWLQANTDKDYLKDEQQRRDAEADRLRREAAEKERIDKERQKEEFKKRKETYEKQQKKSATQKKAGKILPIILLAVVVIGGGYATIKYGLPYLNYMDAKSTYDKGFYDEAKVKFEKMGDYADSKEMVYKCTYTKAQSYAASGSYKAAAEMYQSIDGYQDSGDKYIETMKLYADKLCEEAKYIEAMKIFEQLDATDEANYENCRKNLYNMASSDYKKNNYKKAYEKFSFLSDYKDSKEKANQSLYILAKLDYEKLDYKNALKKYDKIKGFKDVDEKIKKYSTLINLISAVGEDGTPAVWNAYNVKCPKCGADAEYIFEFRDNGQYNVGVKCSKEGSYVAKEGRFRIEGNVLYDAEYHDGIMHFKKMADIKKINKNVTDKEGKNISIEMTDPVNSKNKSTITIYGNIISDDTASLG